MGALWQAPLVSGGTRWEEHGKSGVAFGAALK